MGLFSLAKRGWGDLTATCNYLKGGSRADAARLFSVVAAGTMRDNSHKPQLEKFRLDIRKNFFPGYSGRGQIFFPEDFQSLSRKSYS